MNHILQKPGLLGSLTGLTPEEFNDLALSFTQVWQEHTRRNWLGQKRPQARGAGSCGGLATPEQKLLFSRFYFRHYLVQEVLGALFGFRQSQANKWLLRLTPRLQRALQRELLLPQRHPARLDQVRAACPALKRLLDGPAGMSFADGHALIHKWVDPRTYTSPSGTGQGSGGSGSISSAGNQDVAWLATITSAATK